MAGDYTVIPQPEDAARPESWTKGALFLPERRAAFRLGPGLVRRPKRSEIPVTCEEQLVVEFYAR